MILGWFLIEETKDGFYQMHKVLGSVSYLNSQTSLFDTWAVAHLSSMFLKDVKPTQNKI